MHVTWTQPFWINEPFWWSHTLLGFIFTLVVGERVLLESTQYMTPTGRISRYRRRVGRWPKTNSAIPSRLSCSSVLPCAWWRRLVWTSWSRGPPTPKSTWCSRPEGVNLPGISRLPVEGLLGPRWEICCSAYFGSCDSFRDGKVRDLQFAAISWVCLRPTRGCFGAPGANGPSLR